MASIGHLAVGAAIGAIYSRTTGSNSRISIVTTDDPNTGESDSERPTQTVVRAPDEQRRA